MPNEQSFFEEVRTKIAANELRAYTSRWKGISGHSLEHIASIQYPFATGRAKDRAENVTGFAWFGSLVISGITLHLVHLISGHGTAMQLTLLSCVLNLITFTIAVMFVRPAIAKFLMDHGHACIYRAELRSFIDPLEIALDYLNESLDIFAATGRKQALACVDSALTQKALEILELEGLITVDIPADADEIESRVREWGNRKRAFKRAYDALARLELASGGYKRYFGGAEIEFKVRRRAETSVED